MLHDFAEKYKNDQQDAIQKACFRNQCFNMFTASCYTKSANNSNVRNDNLIVVTKISTMMESCLRVVFKKLSTRSNIRT